MTDRTLVLVAIDHATDVERAIGFALSIARARGADVHVLEVLPHHAVRFDGHAGLWRFESSDRSGISIGARVASVVRSGDGAGARARVRRLTLRGTPEQAIPAYAQLHQAALLVVERNYGSWRFWRNGRVVDELARQSPVPVLVLPKNQPLKQEQHGFRRILAPIDFSVASAVALRTAADLSRRHGARVTLLHAIQDSPRHLVFSGSEAWGVVRRLPGLLESVAQRLRRRAAVFGANDVDTEVATGDADGAIVEIARRTDADLIVMGVAHRSSLDRLMFGSTLRRLLRRATVPVLVIPVVAGAHAWPDEQRSDSICRSSSTVPFHSGTPA